MTKTLTTSSEEETAAAGRELGQTMVPGSIVLLYGDLAAGKTAFVRGLAEGLGIDPAEVTSPTFTLIQEYRGGRVPLFHVDLYRLNHAREIDELGLETADEGVLAVEWAERLPRIPPGATRVTIEDGGGDTRTITIGMIAPG